jgi:hypothetical protein
VQRKCQLSAVGARTSSKARERALIHWSDKPAHSRLLYFQSSYEAAAYRVTKKPYALALL